MAADIGYISEYTGVESDDFAICDYGILAKKGNILYRLFQEVATVGTANSQHVIIPYRAAAGVLLWAARLTDGTGKLFKDVVVNASKLADIAVALKEQGMDMSPASVSKLIARIHRFVLDFDLPARH